MRHSSFISPSSILAKGLVAAGFLAALAMPAWGKDEDSPLPPPISCRNGLIGGVNCIATKQDIQEARRAFDVGVKLQKRQRPEEALEQFTEAARLNPQSLQFLRAREMVKAKLVFDHLERGNAFLSENARIRAAAEFRVALDLDPENPYAQDRWQESTRELAAKLPDILPARLADSEQIHLSPSGGKATLHFSGDVRGLFSALAAAYDVKVQFDDSVQARQVRFNVDDVDFLTVLKLACRVSKTMWTALDTRQVFIAADTTENHKQFDRISLRTFVLPPHSSPAEATELSNAVRTMFDLQKVSVGQTAGMLEVRGPQDMVEACAQLMEQLSNQRPQVVLDVHVFQISHQLTRNMGVHVPNTFNLYNIPAVALAGLGGSNIQQLINQLIASGGVNQLGSSSLSGLLAQLGGQQNSIFSQPLATFGGGLTFMGLSLDKLAAELSVNESWVRSLENMSMRAGEGSDTTFHLGERFPILNASYAPIYNSPQISQVLGNRSYIPPFPSVSYEDLGLQMKAKPTIHGDGSVSLQLELQVRSLTGQSANGVPVISNKEYKGSINLKDGEPAFVAGEISRTDTLSMSGLPGLGFLPGLNMAMVNNTKEQDDDELMISITPHVVANFAREPREIWLSQN